MTEETAIIPNWLKDLEEKRERRLKARLGHETGAGSPCLTCEEKCPGLDLHFWRKICKNCKCSKENHNVVDEDLYGWAQFQLVGSKPIKSRKIVLPGKKEEVELEWVPKGQKEVIDSYLRDLPPELLPVKGSTAAKERKQLLQKQIPVHDIDPTLCHALSEAEIVEMNSYIAQVKKNSAGIGHIVQLSLKGQLHKMGSADAHVLANRFPAHLPNSEIVQLQGSDRSNMLKSYANLPKNLQKALSIGEIEQNPLIIKPVTGIWYDSYGNLPNLNSTELLSQANKAKFTPNVPLVNTIENQVPTNFANIKDLEYKTGESKLTNFGSKLPHFAPSSLSSIEENQNPLAPQEIRNIYGDHNVNVIRPTNFANPLLEKQNVDNISKISGGHLPHFAPGGLNIYSELQGPKKIGNIHDLAYSTYSADALTEANQNTDISPHSANSRQFSAANYKPNAVNIRESVQNPSPVNIGIISDINYPPNEIKAAHKQKNELFESNIPQKIGINLPISNVNVPECHRCQKKFEDKAIAVSAERTDALWHASCFKCAACNQNLADLVYFYNKKSDDIYCLRDYAKIRGIPRCNACDELIFVKEYCLAQDSTFHVKHFCCYECDVPLAGQNYIMEESQPLCLPCYEKLKAEKCNACFMIIKPDEAGITLKDVHFHANDACFSCTKCKKSLISSKVLFKNEKLYCSSTCYSSDN